MKLITFFSSALFIFGVVFTPFVTNAASLYIDPGMNSLNRGDSVTLAVRLDTDEAAGECVNAVDGVLKYSENIEPVDISIGKSIFNIWVESPTINREERTVTFAGGIPNGYCGRVIGDPRLTNILTEIVFRSPGFSIGASSDDAQAVIEFSDESTAYLNDGQGTKARLTTYGATIDLSKTAGPLMVNDWKEQVAEDIYPPEEFSVYLQKDDKAFSQKYYVVFNTSDKQTGIDQYQIMEEPLAQFGSFQWGRADAPWLVAKSPYVLKDQTLNSIIRVKAIDKAGNEYIANYIPDDSMRTISKSDMLFAVVTVGAIFSLLIVGFFVSRFIYRRRRLSKSVHKDEVEVEEKVDSIENLYE